MLAVAGATFFAHALLPTMLAGAGATQCAHALLPTMIAGAGATQYAHALPPTMLAVAGATFFAPVLPLTMLAEVFAAVYFAVPRPYAMTAHGASIHRDILDTKRMKHMHWCICLTSLTGLGRCHCYILLVISGRKSQHLQLSSKHAVFNPLHAQLVTNASQPVDMNGSRSLTPRCASSAGLSQIFRRKFLIPRGDAS
jgi:hypothetical protein